MLCDIQMKALKNRAISIEMDVNTYIYIYCRAIYLLTEKYTYKKYTLFYLMRTVRTYIGTYIFNFTSTRTNLNTNEINYKRHDV